MNKPVMTKTKKRLLFIWSPLFLLYILSLITGFMLQTTTYEIYSDKIDDEIRIVLITDLHNTVFGKNQKQLIGRIKDSNPDLILLAGDIFHDYGSRDGAHMLMEGIQGLAPAYFVTGNHDLSNREISLILNEVTSYGITILSDSFEEIEIKGNRIIVAGIDDPVKGYNHKIEMQRAFGELHEKGGYKILLAHRPEDINYYTEHPFDLVVSGHAHGGQVFVPFINRGLYVPHQGILAEYAGGLYEHGTLTHIVSRGLSIKHPSPIIPRVNNRPELVVISVKSAN
ncbi:MAG: metallophosphoesterase [Oscillospiraceae bacterium]|nr:metallophosphoesterase [Oscillospiraceae bacterium]